MKCLTIIDFNPLLFATIPKLRDLAPDGVVRIGLEDVYTELTYRLIMEFATRPYSDYDTDYLIVNDSDHYFRRDLYPDYKGKRSPKPSCYSTGCVSLGKVPHNVEHGFEADDLIAYAAIKLKSSYDKIRIHTCDGDMNQLIDAKTEVCQTMIYNPEEAIIDEATLERWFTKRVITLHPKKNQHIKKWKAPKHKTIHKYWDGCAKTSVLALKAGYGDSSDNYPKDMDPIIYDLHISPIHKLDIDLRIGKADAMTNVAYLDSLQKWLKKGNRLIRNWFENPYVPIGDGYNDLESNALSGFGWS